MSVVHVRIPVVTSPAADRVLELIDKHSGHLLVKTSPLGQVLPAMREWVIDVERRLARQEELR